MRRTFGLLPIVLALLAPACDDDCRDYWTCYFDGCCTRCYVVVVCGDGPYPYYPYYPYHPAQKDDLDLVARVRDAGAGTVDVEVEVLGNRVDGETPVSVRLLGDGLSTTRRQSAKVLWGFYGVRAEALEALEAEIPGTRIGIERPLAGSLEGGSIPCDPRARWLGRPLLPGPDATRRLGWELLLEAPPAADVLATGGYTAIAYEVEAPRSTAKEERLVRAGEADVLRLDRRGTWRIRATVLLEDACGEGSVDAMAVEDAAIVVR